MQTLDEKQRRRPDFRGGVPVRLLDGQEWWFVKPRAAISCDDQDGYTVFVEAGDPRFEEAYRAYPEAEEGTAVIRLEILMGRLLLQANYDLTNREVSSIMRFAWNEETGDPEAIRIHEEVMGVVFGRGKKPLPGGDASPASSPAPQDPPDPLKALSC